MSLVEKFYSNSVFDSIFSFLVLFAYQLGPTNLHSLWLWLFNKFKFKGKRQFFFSFFEFAIPQNGIFLSKLCIHTHGTYVIQIIESICLLNISSNIKSQNLLHQVMSRELICYRALDTKQRVTSNIIIISNIKSVL